MGVINNSGFSIKSGLTALAALAFLSGCETLREAAATTPDTVNSAPAGVEAIEKDVERPDVFAVTEKALWDGRPSLGGVWVAYPANVDPERVVIRNGSNGKSVIGALFRRERENPGPRIQLSSDAASALGIVAGTPTEISIVVLRRETVEVALPPAAEPEAESGQIAGTVEAPARRAPPARAATPARPADPHDEAGESLAAIVEQTLADIDPSAAQAPERTPIFRLRKPNIQVASFAEEQRAKDLVTLLSNEGVQAEIRVEDNSEPVLYRVVSGPSRTRAERTARLRIIKGLGFADAFYFR